jgi:hypothetical protein
MQSGALSVGARFVNMYREAARRNVTLFDAADYAAYAAAEVAVRAVVTATFAPRTPLHLASPTFFSRLTAAPAVTAHDEYWHSHVDKRAYGSFDVTCLLYLADHGTAFAGGEFVFDAAPAGTAASAGGAGGAGGAAVVEPREGRLSCFPSGAENPHHVARVTEGTRYALTVAYTCDARQGIRVPTAPPPPPSSPQPA